MYHAGRFVALDGASNDDGVGGEAMYLAEILQVAVREQASDVILKDGIPPMLRVHSDLHPLAGADPLTSEQMQNAASTVLFDDRKRAVFDSERQADLAFDMPGLGRFRINVYRQRGKLGIVLRTIPTLMRSFEALNLPPVVERLANEKRGLILVTGPTGSGKTTTIASILDHINRSHYRHVVTIEDPIEYVHQDDCCVISQREIGNDTHDFPAALRAALRQNPDVIMVGEMRDLETIDTAIMAAETGHLVLSTLHTVDAPETISRIVASFPEDRREQVRIVLSNVVRGIISQRLIRNADRTGMVPAVEVLVGSTRVHECIDKNRIRELHDAMAQGAVTYGMQTFDQSLLELLREGMITHEDALLHSSNPADFELQARGINAGALGELESRAAVEKASC
jgi:twitching motility protein PilT